MRMGGTDDEIIQFKDPNFLKALLIKKEIGFSNEKFQQDVDKNGDGQISFGEAKQVVALNLYDYKEDTTEPLYELTDINEIKYFSNLAYLNCGGHKLTDIDVSKNTALTWLACEGNLLTALDVSRNQLLKTLQCGGNQLTTIDLSANKILETLDCRSNLMTTLDVSNNRILDMLVCSYNRLTSLDVSNNGELYTLWCSGNQLTKLILHQQHRLGDDTLSDIESEYGNIIEFAE